MAERSADIADYVQYVVENLVDNSDQVNVTEQVEGDELYVDIEVDAADRGRVIGKSGRLIRSLRVVVRAAAGRDGTLAHVELLEDDDSSDNDSSDTADSSAADSSGATSSTDDD